MLRHTLPVFVFPIIFRAPFFGGCQKWAVLTVCLCPLASTTARSTHATQQAGINSTARLKWFRNALSPWMQRSSLFFLLRFTHMQAFRYGVNFPRIYNHYFFQCCLYWLIQILSHYYFCFLHHQWCHQESRSPKFNNEQVVKH